MSKTDLKRIGDLIGGVKALSLIKAWKKASGPIFGSKVRFHGIRRDAKGIKVLVLDLHDPIWKQELLFESEKLLEIFRHALKEEGVPSHEWPDKISLTPSHSLPFESSHSQLRRQKMGLKG